MPSLSRNSTVIIRSGSILVLGFALLLLPLRWVVAWIAAASVHELAHLAALRLLKVRLLSVEIRATGAKINTEPLGNIQGLFCAISGPAAGALLVFMGPWMPRVAMCAFLQTVWNLLPMSGLDGGVVLKCLLGLFRCTNPERICQATEILIISAFTLLGIWMSFCLHLGWMPILWIVSLVFRQYKEKALANRTD